MADSFRQTIRSLDIGSATKRTLSQYGYDGRTQRSQGFGPGSHYVYPNLKDDTIAGANGLTKSATPWVLAAGAGANITSKNFDLSGWARWTLYGAMTTPGAGIIIYTQLFLDPLFSNIHSVLGSGVITAATFILDSQQLAINNSAPAPPYVNFFIQNQDAANAHNLNLSLFCYDYLAK